MTDQMQCNQNSENTRQNVSEPQDKSIHNSENIIPTEMCLYHDTGHHFLFIELTDKFFSHYDPEKKIRKRCLADRAAWCEYIDNQNIAYKWIRWRFGVKNTKPGLWLSVETNLGTIKRGCLTKEIQITENEIIDKDAINNQSPYPFSSLVAASSAVDASGRYLDHQLVDITINSPYKEGEYIALAAIEFIWMQTQEDRDVDIIVDFGNTRTIVLALENKHNVGGNNFASSCRPIPILARGEEYTCSESNNLSSVIIDSWFLMQESIFAEWNHPTTSGEMPFTSSEYELQPTQNDRNFLGIGGKTPADYKKIERIPQMFVDVAPVIMGNEARVLLSNVDLSRGLNLSLSSPKRYLWDDGRNGKQGIPWNMNTNRWSPRARRNAPSFLAGSICRFMYSDGRDWDIDNPPYAASDVIRPRPNPSKPNFTRNHAMVWAALHIMENAYRHITSEQWSKGDEPFVRRKLRSFIVTFPSGWIGREVESYRKAWNRARDIFTLSHMANITSVAEKGGCKPEVNLKLDEAVASQLPFLYSEISRLASANEWISLYGGGRDHDNLANNVVRVMTVDIGGGTTDTSIVEYTNTSPTGVALNYNVLFRDCSTAAGDSVVLAIIQRVLLPSILVARGALKRDKDGFSEPDENTERVCQLFSTVLSTPRSRQTDDATWQRITKLFFIPIVRQWLTDVANCPKGYYVSDSGDEFRKISDMPCSNSVDESAVDDFNDMLGDELANKFGCKVSFDDKLEYSPKRIRQCIYDELLKAIDPLAKFAAAYEVDLVTLSGKISEMPTVYEMLKSKLPILPQRIVRMKDYYAGNWYPMSDGGRISDAKSVTAIGAAIFAASECGTLPWGFRRNENNAAAVKNFWGPIAEGNANIGFAGGLIILAPEEMSNEDKTYRLNGQSYNGTPLRANCFIGRQKYNAVGSRPERQYQLMWKGTSPPPHNDLMVIIERVEPNGFHEAGDDDDIRLVSVEGTGDEVVRTSDFALVLCTIDPEQGFWMESCLYVVDYTNEKYS